jgi:hypothetical protein
LNRFPFPLVAKNVAQEPKKAERWVFRGFWRGRGEVRFSETTGGDLVEGFEEIAAGRAAVSGKGLPGGLAGRVASAA